MHDRIPIPEIDPVSLPAPVWLLKVLLLLTFFLHIIPMNFALGGGFVAAVTDFIGRKKNRPHHLALAKSLARMLPILIAFTITLGIAPLLFVQVLYGQFFYTSSILIAWPWLSVIVLLILSYYGFYLYAFRWERLEGKRLIVVLVSAVLFASIGFIYTNNLVLMLTPQKWAAMYFENPHGTRLNLSDPTVIPRFLHFFVASFALTGILVALYGLLKRRNDVELGRWAVRYGILWFVGPTVLQLGVGSWFFLNLPDEVSHLFLGGSGFATGVFLTAMACALLSVVLMLIGYGAKAPSSKVISGVVLIAITLVCMVIMRDLVRDAYLGQYYDPTKFTVEPQTGVIIIFVALLLVGLGIVGYMLKKVVASRS
jgi:hypothetical protein